LATDPANCFLIIEAEKFDEIVESYKVVLILKTMDCI
jgi:hypothetical protein